MGLSLFLYLKIKIKNAYIVESSQALKYISQLRFRFINLLSIKEDDSSILDFTMLH